MKTSQKSSEVIVRCYNCANHLLHTLANQFTKTDPIIDDQGVEHFHLLKKPQPLKKFQPHVECEMCGSDRMEVLTEDVAAYKELMRQEATTQ